MEKQHQLINKEFETRKGDLEQLDDVYIIGIRVSSISLFLTEV
ncbi:MAG: hypothetical protein ACI9J3_000749 [Parvicellaceae bacterium]|jgi:hypothetical protein